MPSSRVRRPLQLRPAKAALLRQHRWYVKRLWLLDIGAVLIIGVLSLTYLLGHIELEQKFSVYDEWTHADYVWQVSHGNIPARGDLIAVEVAQQWACHGQQSNITPSCGSDDANDPRNFQGKGLNYNYFHPPLYYAVNGAIATPLADHFDLDFVDSARAANATLVTFSVVLFYLAMRGWKLRPGPALGAVLLLMCNPAAIHAGTYVTNDGINIFAGAGIIWLLKKVYRDRKYPVIRAALLMAVVAASKTVSTIGLIAVGVLLGVRAAKLVLRRRAVGEGLRSLATATALALPVVSITLWWGQYQESRGDEHFVSPVAGVNSIRLDTTPWTEWAQSATSGFTAGRGTWLSEEVNGWGMMAVATVAIFVLSTAALVGAAAIGRKRVEWGIAATLLLGVVLVPILVNLQAATSGLVFPRVSSRYAVHLLPLAAMVWALVAQRRRRGGTLLLAGAIGFCVILLTMYDIGIFADSGEGFGVAQ